MNRKILENYESPVSYLSLYELCHNNYTEVRDSGEFTVLGLGGEEEDNLKRKLEIYQFTLNVGDKNLHDKFCEDKDFVKLFVVMIFITRSDWSTRSRDCWEEKTEYCLYHRGIRVTDEYIEAILPKPKIVDGSEYRSSSRYVKKHTSYHVSHLETERFLEKYNLDDHCNFIAYDLNTEKYDFGKVESQIVFHEFGHLFGYFICDKLGYNLGEIEEVALKNISSKQNCGHVKIKNDWYRFRPNLTPNEKQYDLQRIKRNLNQDIRKLLAYITYILFGGVFNLWFFKIKPKYEDFDDIYFDYNEFVEYGNFKCMAGNDFTKISDYRVDLDWNQYDFDKFKFLAYELFYILDKHMVFYHLSHKNWFNSEKYKVFLESVDSRNKHSMMELFELNFNGEITSDKEKIQLCIELMKDSLPEKTIERLICEIDLLINKYILDVSRSKP